MTEKKVSPSEQPRLLFQKLGTQWYAFSVVDGECFYTPISQTCFNIPRRKKSAKNRKASTLKHAS